MPALNVSEVTTDVDFADCFNVFRRTETVGNDGFSSNTPMPFLNQVGVVYAHGRNELDRKDGYDTTFKELIIVTKFRLQATSPGIKPDLVQWPTSSPDRYIVDKVEDFSRYGVGFVRARCTVINFQEQPPSPEPM